ncbi:hypothetical protein M7I_3747 [Glarea lozoyensis 74030]|uniref:Uncharacterized protein n=1 Tax=Glarea lozoyensis (strain ATCC 74030 / MF5533) TaxID=1104152 RepID=H0EMB6_GLAL7|nr:hypothetical protein M7I_3747 [Glarea lozoyensis 74030]
MSNQHRLELEFLESQHLPKTPKSTFKRKYQNWS